MAEKLLYIALDNDSRDENEELVYQIEEAGVNGHYGYKVNLDHVLIWGRNYLNLVLESQRPVFADLKMNNGPRTMANVAKWLGSMGVSHTNVWAHTENNLATTIDKLSTVSDRPAILANTFYTRWNKEYAQAHHRMDLEELVVHWSKVAVENGADGIILPGMYLPAVNKLDKTKVVPGIRLPGQETQSQQRLVSSPQEAVEAGADILVVGSPIYKAIDPVRSLRTFLAEMAKAA